MYVRAFHLFYIYINTYFAANMRMYRVYNKAIRKWHLFERDLRPVARDVVAPAASLTDFLSTRPWALSVAASLYIRISLSLSPPPLSFLTKSIPSPPCVN